MTRGPFPYVSQHWPTDSARHIVDPEERAIHQRHWSDRSCGLACVEMIVRHRLGRTLGFDRLLADALAQRAYCERGWIHAGLASLLGSYGVVARAVPASPEEVIASLQAGALFIASVHLRLPEEGPERGGHLILLRGARRVGSHTYIQFSDPSGWGALRTSIRANRLFHSYSGRGVLIPVPPTPSSIFPPTLMHGSSSHPRLAIVCPPTVDYAQRYAHALVRRGVQPVVFTTVGAGQSDALSRHFETECLDALDARGESLLARLRGIDGLVGVIAAGEFAVVPTERAAAALGLQRSMRGDANVLRDKAAMRAAFAAHGVPQPKVLGTAGSEEELRRLAAGIERYPVICKPVDMAGSWYVSLNATPAELIANAGPIFDYAVSRQTGLSLAARCLVEEYADGPEYSVEAVVHRGDVRHRFLTRKITSAPPAFDEVAHVSGLDLDEPRWAAINDMVRRVVAAAQIDTAVMHIEFRMTAGCPCVMEAAARVGGDQITRLVELQHGVSLEEALVAMRLGEAPPAPAAPQSHVTAIRFHFDRHALPPVEGETVLDSGALNPGAAPAPGLTATHLQNRRGFEIFRAPASAVKRAFSLSDVGVA